MKKYLFALLAVVLFFSSCEEVVNNIINYTYTDPQPENSGKIVDGIWGLESLTPSVSVSGGTSVTNALAIASLNMALNQLATPTEPSAYEFASTPDSAFISYKIVTSDEGNVEAQETGSGIYSITADSLILNFNTTYERKAYEVFIINDSVISINKDYKSDFLEWGASYAGVTIDEAVVNIKYVFAE